MAVAMAPKTGGEAFVVVGEREEVGLGAGEFGKVILSVLQAVLGCVELSSRPTLIEWDLPG